MVFSLPGVRTLASLCIQSFPRKRKQRNIKTRAKPTDFPGPSPRPGCSPLAFIAAFELGQVCATQHASFHQAELLIPSGGLGLDKEYVTVHKEISLR